MKTIKSILIISVIALMTSCASTVKFPVSRSVPAAEITATKKQNKQNNYVVELKAKNLADASRLNPPKKNYSVWIVDENGETKNIGQLNPKSSRTATLKTMTPFNVKQIFITAEDQGNLTYPAGVEISRAFFKR